MSENHHIFHLRFFKGKYLTTIQIQEGYACDKIVTGVWSFDHTSNTLRYGATVYHKDSNRDTWVGKKLSVVTALQRYNEIPVLVKLTCIRYPGIDRVIAPFVVITCINNFGCFNKYYEVDGCTISIPYCLNVDTQHYEELAAGVYDNHVCVTRHTKHSFKMGYLDFAMQRLVLAVMIFAIVVGVLGVEFATAA